MSSISLFRSVYYTTETKQCFMLIETKTALIGQMLAFVGQAELWITLKLIYEKVCQIWSVKKMI